MLVLQVALVITKRKFISLFKAAKVIRFLLHRVIGQMDEFVGQLGSQERPRWSPQVTIIVHVALQLVVSQCHHAKAADVKLALVVQCWALNVLLDDESPCPVDLTMPNDLLDLFQGCTHVNTLALICVLPRLDYPNVFFWRRRPIVLVTTTTGHLLINSLRALIEWTCRSWMRAWARDDRGDLLRATLNHRKLCHCFITTSLPHRLGLPTAKHVVLHLFRRIGWHLFLVSLLVKLGLRLVRTFCRLVVIAFDSFEHRWLLVSLG